MITDSFDYAFSAYSNIDIGKRRIANQDKIISCPEYGFFAVCDGMGGLPSGGEASNMVATIMPGIIALAHRELSNSPSPQSVASILKSYVQMISNNIYETGNRNGIVFGSTFCGVWLIESHAVFVNIGDSRGYILPKFKRTLRQVTKDHNAAAYLVEQGELTKSQAINHPASSRLTQFLGMQSPAFPDTFIEKVHHGDRIMLCSDGLYSMVNEAHIKSILRSSKSQSRVCNRLIDTANENGGRDNISVAYIKIQHR